MTAAFAKAKYVRTGQRKVRRIAHVISTKPAGEALRVLAVLPHKGARILSDVLHSAMANAQHTYHMKEADVEKLRVRAWVDRATPLRRFRPRQRGRAFPIQKQTSHIVVSLSPAGAV